WSTSQTRTPSMTVVKSGRACRFNRSASSARDTYRLQHHGPAVSAARLPLGPVGVVEQAPFGWGAAVLLLEGAGEGRVVGESGHLRDGRAGHQRVRGVGEGSCRAAP